MQEVKVAIIIVLYKTPKQDLKRLKKQFKFIIPSGDFYVVDNTNTGKGYAEGVNQGLKRAIKMSYDGYIIANPDISLPRVDERTFLSGLKSFDILGFAMKQNGTTYYGGKIDKWYLSGGLINRRATQRYSPVDFVSGSLILIKKDVIRRVGFFKETYFMYYEDVDYCYRASQKGFRVGVDCDISYQHSEVSLKNPRKDALLSQAHRKFFEIYGNPLQKFRLYIRDRLKS